MKNLITAHLLSEWLAFCQDLDIFSVPNFIKRIIQTQHIFAIYILGWELSFFGICKLSNMSVVLVVDIDGAGEAVA